MIIVSSVCLLSPASLNSTFSISILLLLWSLSCLSVLEQARLDEKNTMPGKNQATTSHLIQRNASPIPITVMTAHAYSSARRVYSGSRAALDEKRHFSRARGGGGTGEVTDRSSYGNMGASPRDLQYLKE